MSVPAERGDWARTHRDLIAEIFGYRFEFADLADGVAIVATAWYRKRPEVDWHERNVTAENRSTAGVMPRRGDLISGRVAQIHVGQG